MKAKPNSKSELFKGEARPGKPRTSKGNSSRKPEFLTYDGKDAETIRKEVMRVKEKLVKRLCMFEQLGDNDLLKFKED